MTTMACPDCKCGVENPNDGGCPFCSNEASDLVEVEL
jgi:endogenous inhibitor of DNA gyrase (YacG/DUF329 family)